MIYQVKNDKRRLPFIICRQPRVLAALLATCVFFFVHACADPPADEAADAAAHPIIEPSNSVTLDVLPSATIGESETNEHHSLHEVKGAAVLSDNRIVVGNSGSQSLSYFDMSGRFLYRAGRSGHGPGEFQRLRSLYLLNGDTVAVWDVGAKRISLFDRSGDFLRSSNVRSNESNDPRLNRLLDLYLLNSDLFVSVTGNLLPQPHLRRHGFSRDSHFVAIVDRAGRQVDTIGMLAGSEWYRGKEAVLAPFSHRFLVASMGGAFYVGSGRSPFLTEYDQGGGIVRILKLPIERRRVDRQTKAAARQRFVDRFRQNDRAAFAEAFDDAFRLDSVPAFVALVGARDGSGLWIQLYDTRFPMRRWLVIDPKTSRSRTVHLPAKSRILEATRDHVVLLLTDELDRERIELRACVPTCE